MEILELLMLRAQVGAKAHRQGSKYTSHAEEETMLKIRWARASTLLIIGKCCFFLRKRNEQDLLVVIEGHSSISSSLLHSLRPVQGAGTGRIKWLTYSFIATCSPHRSNLTGGWILKPKLRIFEQSGQFPQIWICDQEAGSYNMFSDNMTSWLVKCS